MKCLGYVLVLVLVSSIDSKISESLMKLHLPTNCNTKDAACCLEPVYINFRKLFGTQFESILYPKGIDIGRCRDVSNNESMARLNSLGNKNSSACCVPIEYKDVKVLVYEKHLKQIVVKTIPDVKISKCGYV